MKICILVCTLLILNFCFSVQKSQSDSFNLLTGADIDKGDSITQTILDQSKAIFQQAYVFYGDSVSSAAQYIRTKLNELYEGNYVVIIFNDNTTSPIVGTNLQVSIQSMNSSWWFYWKGPNHYKPTFSYFIARSLKNATGTTLAVNGNDSSTFVNTTTRNVINAVQQDSTDVGYNVKNIKYYISALNPTKKVNVMVTKNVSYYLSVEGITGYDHFSPTPLLKYHDVIWYTL